MKKYVNSTEEEQLFGAPDFWVKSGLWIFVVIFVVVASAALFVRVPEVISGEVHIKSDKPPVSVIVDPGLVVKELMVESGQTVEAGDIVAVIDNDLNIQDALFLKNWIDSNRTFLLAGDTPNLSGLQRLQLADLSVYLNSFVAAVKEYCITDSILGSGTVNVKSFQWYGDMQQLQLRKINEMKQMEAVALQVCRRDSLLLAAGAITQIDAEKSQRELLRARSELSVAMTDLASMQISGENAQTSRIEKESGVNQFRAEMFFRVLKEFHTMESELALWTRKHIVTAPCNGTILLTIVTGNYQKAGDDGEICQILPPEAGNIFGTITMDGHNAGKALPGQQAVISLDFFPESEFGNINGEITKIWPIETDGRFKADLALPDGLKTGYGIDISYIHGMKGRVKIITSNRNLLSLLFFPHPSQN
ncbi:MAG: hypothetical protein KKA07_12280 [Bacteroidetes bacterium]|nr:hypothetical protein [Bacteroidota bacterium]MBU1719835.1 hypothetical protein [Bacteroidota bacterium]